MKIYQMAEAEHTTLGGKLGNYILIFVLVSTVPTAISPISYMLFQFPTPNQWQLPVLMKYIIIFLLFKENPFF